jgi:type II secretory pathway component PulM
MNYLAGVRQWWGLRQSRERHLILLALATVVLAIFVVWAEALWNFYRTRPLREAQALQRAWLVEDVERLQRAAAASASPSPVTGQFLAQANKTGVNGTCIAESQGQTAGQSWQCKGELAQLEAVQQWWLVGRREGYYVERFEATHQSPGVIRWTMVVRR